MKRKPDRRAARRDNPAKREGAMVTREELFQAVWAEPMTHVAHRFNVSGSYLARVCDSLNVPRPERGYWAKLSVGRAPSKPELPPAEAGTPTSWKPGDYLQRRRPASKQQSGPVAPSASGEGVITHKSVI